MSGIDLHTHSTASDGTEAPAVVVQLGEAGRTHGHRAHRPRHDARLGRGGRRGARGTASAGPRHRDVVPRDGRSIHLLGYLPDPDDPGWSPSWGARGTAATPGSTGWSR